MFEKAIGVHISVSASLETILQPAITFYGVINIREEGSELKSPQTSVG